MHLGLEYLCRHHRIEPLLFEGSSSCTIFANDIDDHRLVITIEKVKDGYIIKKWNLAECNQDQALPPMEESFIRSLDQLDLGEYKPLRYECPEYRSDRNSYKGPMMQDLYNRYHKHLLDSEDHREVKLEWLWGCFLLVYDDNGLMLEDYYYFRQNYNFSGRNIEQEKIFQDFLQKEPKRLVRFWQIWKTHMFDQSHTSGELLMDQNDVFDAF